MGAQTNAIVAVIERLRARLGRDAFDVVEQWDSDVCAVGLSRPNERPRLVYISTCDLPEGRYDVSLDAPGNTAEWPARRSGSVPRPASGHHAAIDFDALADLVSAHLGLGKPGST